MSEGIGWNIRSSRRKLNSRCKFPRKKICCSYWNSIWLDAWSRDSRNLLRMQGDGGSIREVEQVPAIGRVDNAQA